MAPNRSNRSGYTLLELLVACASSAVLLVGLSSSIYVASQALDLESSTLADRGRDGRAAQRMLEDVSEALRFTERTASAIAFTVPDRDGDGAPDKLRYAWSGVAGDPLTLETNGAAPTDIIHDVQSLSFTALTRTISSSGVTETIETPVVLLVVADASALTAAEQDRQAVLTGWGYQVDITEDGASETDFNNALTGVDLVYVSPDIATGQLGTKLDYLSRGIVNEKRTMADDFGFSAGAQGHTYTDLEIVDNTHAIASGFATGALPIFTAASNGMRATAAFAAGLEQIGDVDGSPGLAVLEAGATMEDGNPAPGRRVLLPWRANTMAADFTTDGLTLWQRAVEWAR